MTIIEKVELYISKSKDKIKIKQESGILLLFVRTFNDSNILSKASSLAFTSLLSLIPLLAVVFMIFKMFGGREIIDSRVKPILYEFLNPVNGDKLAGYLDQFIESAKVETIGSLGIVFLIVAVYSILKTVEDNFNTIWKVSSARKMIERVKSFLLVLILAPILIVISVTLNGYFEKILKMGDNLWSGFSGFIILYTIPFLLVYLFFIMLNLFIPNTTVHIKNAMIGSLYGTVFYYISKNLFVYYTSAAVSTNVIYGSLAVLPFLMLWLDLFWIIVLSSVKLSFIHQNFSGLAMFVKSRGFGRGDKIRIALDTLSVVYKQYQSREKSVLTEKKISQITKTPIYVVTNIVDQLVKNGILVKTSTPENGIVPSTNGDKIRVQEIIDGLDNQKFTDISSSSDTINNLFTESGNLKNDIGEKILKDIL
ncbi:MAG: hypothetical protein CR982_02575 [Candidatus Cloacimonadota bacterium]|nr:MAG: hypothetical protein CR982_02575 [Candidatus Cloacimonadota bacterium]PIE79315.1 MAG: hypothetical protein CSA15_03430 [Candidatus Delongbacteria bacterium]